MNEFLRILLIVCPLVFLAGFVDSVAGGGGIISLPAYLMAGFPAHLAAGTNKVVNGCGTLIAAIKYFRSGKIRLCPSLAAAIGAIAGSAAGSSLAAYISETALKTVMLIALPCVAVFLVLRRDLGSEDRAKADIPPRKEILISLIIGLVIGCYDGLVGPGTGTFLMLAFTALLSMDLITASGCAKTANLASNISAAVVWSINGSVWWKVAAPAVIFSICGNWLGARYAIKGGSKKIRGMMFVVLALLFAKLLYDVLS